MVQYDCKPSFTVVKILVSKTERGFVEQRDDPAIYRCLYGVLWSFGIQYKHGSSEVPVSVLNLIPKDDKTDLWLSKISDSDNVVAVYVGFLDGI